MAKANTRKRRRSTKRKSSRDGMAPWYLAAVALIGGIVAHEHWEKFSRLPGGREVVALLSEPETKPKPKPPTPRIVRPQEHTGSIAPKPKVAVPPPMERPVEQAAPLPTGRSADSTTFYFCGIRHDNCVIDGDSFLFNGERILIADIDAPETKLAKCDEERSRGAHAKARLRELLNAGQFTVVDAPAGFVDGEAGKRRLVTRNGRSIGGILLAEGLVRKRTARPAAWCGTTARVSG
ncbi:thermonuclease family protein [Sinorhizobium alkalisoli]|uniref:thermonuclease family protein n=1 Tax=Sinorhizobium alkalisoli TaxID=1752398 RepID=UPI00124D340E|nr:thermonuclease family protein [Sinorhizobium alkalisoli]MCA1491756.1 thermonuclease family protein [Ensifer sp. NBAIM29]MCG5479250.1 thermonuclease family protein [Sinorhizobium alkalisoli]QFI66941.1 putative transmembrane protein [Sinorhizobium alkalisoli]